MASVIVATAEKVQQVENDSIVGATINESGQLVLENGAGDDIMVGAVAGTTPDATTTSKGIVELATSAETATGTDINRAVTPAGLATVVAAIVSGTQPSDADLTAIAALAPADDSILQRKSSAWTSRTMAQLATDLIATGSVAKTTTPQNLTDAATIATNAALGNHFRVTLAGNRTLGAPTNPTDGQKVIWEITQDGTGSRTLALASGAGGFAFGTDITSITLTTTASKKDFLGAIYNSTANRWYVVAFTKGF